MMTLILAVILLNLVQFTEHGQLNSKTFKLTQSSNYDINRDSKYYKDWNIVVTTKPMRTKIFRHYFSGTGIPEFCIGLMVFIAYLMIDLMFGDGENQINLWRA